MEVTIKGKIEDFPGLKDIGAEATARYLVEMEKSVRRRLELRSQDSVSIQIDAGTSTVTR